MISVKDSIKRLAKQKSETNRVKQILSTLNLSDRRFLRKHLMIDKKGETSYQRMTDDIRKTLSR